MRSRVVRATLTLLSVAAVGAAGYFYWNALVRLNAASASAASFQDARAAATRATFDLRSAQQAYVAASQNESYWFQKAAASADALRTTFAVLERTTASTESHTALLDAAAALKEFEQRDQRIRGYASSGQKLLAADIIFSDGIDLTARILDALDRAAAAAARDAEAARNEAARQQMAACGGAAAVAIFAMLLLMPLREPSGSEIGEIPATTAPAPRRSLDLDLRPAVKPDRTEVAASRGESGAARTSASSRSVPLGELARVCTDLARLSDSTALPAILDRAAAVLDASGIVLWVADGDRKELSPIAAHGYPSAVLSRLGTIRVDAENATAAAFRTALVQTVRGAGTSSGAIAAPLVSPAGCLGVMAAEVRHGGEKEPARLAAAGIVAAQLATIVGPPAAAETPNLQAPTAG